jgi:hypothetical protein
MQAAYASPPGAAYPQAGAAYPQPQAYPQQGHLDQALALVPLAFPLPRAPLRASPGACGAWRESFAPALLSHAGNFHMSSWLVQGAYPGQPGGAYPQAGAAYPGYPQGYGQPQQPYRR